jgi:hypothetical protein
VSCPKALAQTIRTPGLGVFDVFNNVGVMVKRATGGEQQPSRPRRSMAASTSADGHGSGRVTADGHISGSFKSGGILPGRFWGRMTSSSFGSGSWRLSIGCSGSWTFSKV